MNFSIIKMVLESSTSRIVLRGMNSLLLVAQVVGNVFGVDGSGEEVALGLVAIRFVEEGGLVLRLHSFGHDAQAEGVGGGEDGVDDRARGARGGNVGDEGAIDLQTGDR